MNAAWSNRSRSLSCSYRPGPMSAPTATSRAGRPSRKLATACSSSLDREPGHGVDRRGELGGVAGPAGEDQEVPVQADHRLRPVPGREAADRLPEDGEGGVEVAAHGGDGTVDAGDQQLEAQLVLALGERCGPGRRGRRGGRDRPGPRRPAWRWRGRRLRPPRRRARGRRRRAGRAGPPGARPPTGRWRWRTRAAPPRGRPRPRSPRRPGPPGGPPSTGPRSRAGGCRWWRGPGRPRLEPAPGGRRGGERRSRWRWRHPGPPRRRRPAGRRWRPPPRPAPRSSR